MTNDNQQSDGGESGGKMTRREYTKAAGGAGLLGALTGSGTADVGGGPASDAMAHLDVDLYEGTLSERASAGVSGRYFRVDDQGTPEHGNLYKDTGSQWELIDVGVSNLHSESVNTESVNNKVCVTNYPGNDLGEQFNNAIAATQRDNTYFYAAPGSYTVSTPINATDIHSSVVDLRGSTVTLSTGGQVAIDFSDSWDYFFLFSRLIGDPNSPPSSGVLATNVDVTGHDKGGGPERKWIQGGAMWGEFDITPLFIGGRERTRISGDFTNDAAQGYATVVSQNNNVEIDGSYISETSPYKGDFSSTALSVAKQWFHRASFFSLEEVGDGLLYLDGNLNGTAFRDVEFTASGERAAIIADLSEGNIRHISFSNMVSRVDGAIQSDGTIDASQTANSRFMLAQDGGAGNELGHVHLEDAKIGVDDDTGTKPPMIEATGGVSLFDITVSGQSVIEPGTAIESPNPVEEFDLQGVGVTDVDVAGQMRVTGRDFGPVRLADGASLIGGGARRRVTVSNDGTSHAIGTSGIGGNVIVENVQASATGGSYDAINLSGGGSKFAIRNVRVTGSDRNGIYLNVGEGVAHGLQVDGFGSGVAGDDLVLDDVRTVVSGSYFNGDVRLTGNATDCLVGSTFIRGDLTLESGSSGNDLSNTIVGGTITDNGTSNVTP